MEIKYIAILFVLAIIVVFGVIEYFVREQKVTEEDPNESNQKNSGGGRDVISSSTDQKLDKIYDVLNHIRWIGLGIGGMFALTFIIPQCTGG